MSGRREQGHILQNAARAELAAGRIDRREFITRSLVTGLGLAGVGAIANPSVQPAFAADRPLTPTIYQWIDSLHPGIEAVNAKFPGINYQIAPVQGFGIERFIAEAKDNRAPGTSMLVKRRSSRCRRSSRPASSNRGTPTSRKM